MKLTRKELRADVAALERRIKTGPGVTTPERRQAAVSGAPVEGALGEYLEKVRRAAIEVTDAEVAALRAAGHSDDELFELTIAAAFGAAKERLDVGLDAIAKAFEEN